MVALRFWRALCASVLYGIEARKVQKIIGDTVAPVETWGLTVPALPRLLIASAAIIFYNGEASKVWISNRLEEVSLYFRLCILYGHQVTFHFSFKKI